MTFFEKLTEFRLLLANQLHNPAASGFWKMVVDKYMGQAHFILELIQNADDAQATDARIILSPQGFYFIHNGTVGFSISDPDLEGSGPIGHINAITSIGSSSKLKENLIGKFGIGFKSVFQYTSCPHIEDDNFSFSIHDYIVPIADKRLENFRQPGETLFFLPFSSSNAYSQILATLKHLSNPLLFLRHLSSLQWRCIEEVSSTRFSVEVLKSHSFQLNTTPVDHRFLKISNFQLDQPFSFVHIFSFAEPKTANRCSIVWLATSLGVLKPMLQNLPRAYCFFPTEEQIPSLPFLFHAPFLLTENRESIKKNVEWNSFLLSQLANLASFSIEKLAEVSSLEKFNYLNDNILDVIPLLNNLNENYFLTPFLKSFAECLSSKSVFLSSTGNFVDCNHTKYSSNKSLVSFLSEQGVFHSLFPSKDNLEWCFLPDSLSQTDGFNSSLNKKKFISDHHLVHFSVSLNEVLSAVTANFIESLSPQSLITFYSILSSHKSIFSASLINTAPLLLCSDGKARPKRNEQGITQVFLPSKQEEGFFCVDSTLLETTEVKSFLSLMELTVPDDFYQISYFILPSYSQNKISVNDFSKIAAHLELFASCFAKIAYDDSQRVVFLNQFLSVPFLPVIVNNQDKSFSTPSSVYFYSIDIVNYFAYFPSPILCSELLLAVSPSKRAAVYYFLSSLGLSFLPRVLTVKRMVTPDISLQFHLTPVSLRRYDNGSQIFMDKQIEGFSSFLDHLTPKSSLSFFKLLGRMLEEQGAFMFRKSLYATFTYFPKNKSNSTTEVITSSSALLQLFDSPWLLSVSNNWATANSIDNYTALSDSYRASVDKALYLFLNISYNDDFERLPAEVKSAVSLVRRLKSAGVSEQDLESLIKGDLELHKKSKGGI